MEPKTYKPQTFNLSDLNGISNETLEMHFKLYEGYVTNTNTLNEKIAGLVKPGGVTPADMPTYSELTRRLGFEYNGMVLHEYYFENMKRQGGGEPDRSSDFRKAVERVYPSFDVWKADFASVGNMRGIGWAICYLDPRTGFISNHWIDLHETNNVSGFVPLLVMDVWEHAYLLDYKPAERPKYVDAFLSNVDWSAVDARMEVNVPAAAGR
jgi:Fe-Mn family superoxide dismutase